MAEIEFERFAGVHEATRGTLVTPPTHNLRATGMIDPEQVWKTSDQNYGLLSDSTDEDTLVRQSSKWTADGDADADMLPWWLNLAVAPVTSPTTPGTAILSRLWTFVRNLTADDLKSFTGYWGDPGAQIFQAAYAMLETLNLTGNASGTDLLKQKASGISQLAAKVSAPTWPAVGAGHLFPPQQMQLWLDPAANAFGTTAVTGRVVSADLTIPTGITAKYLAQGPASTLGFSRIGRKKNHATLKIVFEFLDSTQYDLALAGLRQKVRVRWNGALIEDISGTKFYYFVEADVYGRLAASKWGALEGTNRTLELDMAASYLSSAGTDLTVRVQNQRTAL